MVSRLSLMSLLLLFVVMTGCSSNDDEVLARLAQTEQEVDKRLSLLEKHLNAGRLSNGKLIKQYAAYIKSKSPDLAPIASTMESEASSKGALYQGLVMRYQAAVEEGKSILKKTEEERLRLGEEFESIAFAADPQEFNAALADPLNVLADMSGGALARINAGSRKDTESSNGATHYGSASTLVGNPNYGYWQQNSNGTSFWAFYGQYRLLSDLLSGPVYYSNWSRRRDYSYFHDYGRSYYSSPSQKLQSTLTQTRTQKRFEAKGERFSGPYSKRRSTGAAYSKVHGSQNKINEVRRKSNRFSSSLSSSNRLASGSSSSGLSRYKSSSQRSSFGSRGSSNSSRSYSSRGK
ncbi:hypothetical protein [Agarilytica rhodophyticola]|uniref:hypothetical protein n=1 Tax=Agarilytica rhodophyticola TaxID=1737490 RepID=UPI000B34920C|nr:hypothetical protein [Agarilytica rhodophyticola]